jgi:hypothetical protein
VASAFGLAATTAALAHHSAAMFDQDNPVELSGTVREFRYTSPHTFIILMVKGEDGAAKVWTLEGNAPGNLARDGWWGDTLKPGDEIKLTIMPLRSGAPAGSWNATKVKYKNGEPIIAP